MERSAPRASGRRYVIVLAVALYALANSVADVALLWHPFADLGLTVDASHTIIGVDPGRAADRAGVHVGDQIDDAATPASTRRYLGSGVSAVPAGLPLTVAIRGRTGLRIVVLTGEVRRRSFADDATNLVLMLAYLATIMVGAWLVLVRPSRMTWAFFLFCCGWVGDSVTLWVALPDALFAVNAVLYGALNGAASAMLAVFALRFPNDRADGWRRPAERIAWASLALFVPLGVYVQCGVFGWPLGLAAAILSGAGAIGLVFVALVFLLTYVHSSAAERAKVRWVGLGLVIGYAGPLAFVAGSSIPGFASELPLPAINLLQALGIAVPLSVAYVVVRHRVFDVRFVLGRAAVYGVVTSVVVAGVALLDYVAGKVLARTQLTVIAEAAVAIIVGLSLNTVHKRTEATVERVFFRKRRRAEERLRRAGEGLVHADSADAIARALVDETIGALGLASAAVFRRDEGRFARVASRGWDATDCDVLASDESAVLAVGARREPLAVRDGHWPHGVLPHGRGAPVYVLPIILRDRLDAMLFVGAHDGDEQIDPDELATLRALCDAAAGAFDHLDAMIALERAAALEAEVNVLRNVVTSLSRPAPATSSSTSSG